MLPVHFTENGVDRRLMRLYFKRNSFLAGILFTPEFSGYDLVSLKDLPSDPNVFEWLIYFNYNDEKNLN